jgi:hypothetical protein
MSVRLRSGEWLVRLNRAIGAVTIGFLLFADTREPWNATPAQSSEAFSAQVELTEAEIREYIAAQRDLKGIIFRLPDERADLPDVESPAQMQSILKRHGFRSLDEYTAIANNIALVVEGLDPVTKTYIGAAAVLKRQLADIDADPSIAPVERAAASAELDSALKAVAPVKYPGNIDLVVRNLDAILANSPFAGEASNQD